SHVSPASWRTWSRTTATSRTRPDETSRGPARKPGPGAPLVATRPDAADAGLDGAARDAPAGEARAVRPLPGAGPPSAVAPRAPGVGASRAPFRLWVESARIHRCS